MPATKPKFAEGDKVLCHHGSMIYEAKVRVMLSLFDFMTKYAFSDSGMAWSEVMYLKCLYISVPRQVEAIALGTELSVLRLLVMDVWNPPVIQFM